MKKTRIEINVITSAVRKYEKPICTGPEPSHRVMMLAILARTPPTA